MASSALTPVRFATPGGTVPAAGAPWNWTVPGICFQNDSAAELGSTRATSCATVSVAGATTLLQPGTRRIVVAGAAPATWRTRNAVAGPIPGAKKLKFWKPGPRAKPLVDGPEIADVKLVTPGRNGTKAAAIWVEPGFTPR